ncbi:sodium-translocating pyrophosphatase [Streptomyces sp. NPDC050145]|uniref:sodium-translocating pyrophosphatase n=1 Tax=Streptomyces sp. NPDC050145 TaxID=3365602 RepID=UPI0037ACE026
MAEPSIPSHLAAADLTDGNRLIVIVIAVVALAALALAGVLVRQVLSAGEGTDSMKKIAGAVQEGANAYLGRQLRTLAVFAVVVFFLLMLLPADDWNQRAGRSVFFLIGAVFSATTGYIGMWLAVRSNVRVAAAAREAASGESEKDPTVASHKAMKIAFRTGGVVGMFTVGLGLLGASCVVLVYAADAPKVLEGFGLGAALIAMFMRVGGGIFTKAADVGADLVGKIEKGIPEDDPRNAATIADNVGDNVGDCAGMAADLFESYAVTLVAALILGKAAFGDAGLAFPLIVPAIGVVTAMIGIFAVAPRASDRSGMSAINRGFFVSAVISLVLVAVAVYAYLPGSYAELDGAVGEVTGKSGDPRILAIVAVAIGIVLAALIQQLTGYFTETTRRPVRDIGKASLTGPATVVLAGISIGLESAVYTAVLIGLGVYGAFLLGGTSIMLALFAVALAGTGLLTTVGVIVAMDTFGPVSDNAQGIAEMSGDVEGTGAQVLTDLDAVGNTTKAITKGIAIATAVLAAAALFGSYRDAILSAAHDVGEKVGDAGPMNLNMDISQPNNLVGLIVGAAVVFLFSGLAINAVSRSAGSVVYEVRRQFREHPGIMDYTETPEYGRVVDICTKDALRELATPGLLAVMAPIAVGFTLGVGALGAYLAGAIGTGTLMAVFLANSGGAWDNAKKLVEDGHHGGKGSEAHAATVIGDTVGDPFKDTAGPAINPLLKVMNLVSLLIAPAIVKFSFGDDASVGVRVVIAVLALAVIVGAVYVSKRRGIAVDDDTDDAGPATKQADPADPAVVP